MQCRQESEYSIILSFFQSWFDSDFDAAPQETTKTNENGKTSIPSFRSGELFSSKDIQKVPKYENKIRAKNKNILVSEGYSNSLDDLESFKRKTKMFVESTTTTWNIKHKPKKPSDLAVHPKKTEEVRSWLLNSFNEVHAKSDSPPSMILLLSGPPGCGKTVTIDTLSKELNFAIQEWSNPISSTAHKKWDTDFNESYKVHHLGKDDSIPYESHINTFTNFMLRANRYKMLPGLEEKHKAILAPTIDMNQTCAERKIVLLEELPSFRR